MNRFKNLDALRFFSFLAIFAAHTQLVTTAASGPWLIAFRLLLLQGVPFFFVLSSFLLTTLALEERQRTGKFSAGQFLVRRSLRIYPLYFFFLLFCFVGLSLLQRVAGFHMVLPAAWPYLLFIQNFFPADGLFMLVFLWSIAVEEQFYLVYAFVLRYLMHALPWVCGAGLLVHFVFRAAALRYHWSLYEHTLSYLPCFCLGALAGWWYYYRPALFTKLFSPRHAGVLVLIFFACLAGCTRLPDVLGIAAEALIALCMTGLLLAFLVIRFAFAPSLGFLGRRTYGLYVWHGCSYGIWQALNGRISFLKGVNSFTAGLAILGMTIIMALISYRFLERPFLQWKHRFRPLGQAVLPAGAGAVAPLRGNKKP